MVAGEAMLHALQDETMARTADRGVAQQVSLVQCIGADAEGWVLPHDMPMGMVLRVLPAT